MAASLSCIFASVLRQERQRQEFLQTTFFAKHSQYLWQKVSKCIDFGSLGYSKMAGNSHNESKYDLVATQKIRRQFAANSDDKFTYNFRHPEFLQLHPEADDLNRVVPRHFVPFFRRRLRARKLNVASVFFCLFGNSNFGSSENGLFRSCLLAVNV